MRPQERCMDDQEINNIIKLLQVRTMTRSSKNLTASLQVHAEHNCQLEQIQREKPVIFLQNPGLVQGQMLNFYVAIKRVDANNAFFAMKKMRTCDSLCQRRQ